MVQHCRFVQAFPGSRRLCGVLLHKVCLKLPRTSISSRAAVRERKRTERERGEAATFSVATLLLGLFVKSSHRCGELF